MNEVHNEKVDVELRRHFSGIAAHAVDGLDIWLSCQQLVAQNSDGWRSPQSAESWTLLAEHLEAVLHCLITLTDAGDTPLHLHWAKWRLDLMKVLEDYMYRLDLVLKEPEQL